VSEEEKKKGDSIIGLQGFAVDLATPAHLAIMRATKTANMAKGIHN
jgi:hypothetical protein